MAFHLYTINEIYSNADGTIQYIELITNTGGQNFLDGHTIRVDQEGSLSREFEFEADLPSPDTAGKTVLLATSGFAAVSGITPDYVIPDNFLFTTGTATIVFPGDDVANDTLLYSNLPLDGAHALNGLGVRVDNTPRNFADETGVIAATLAGTAGNDTLDGAGGNDVLSGAAGNDTLTGDGGDDILEGGEGADSLVGGAGNDTLDGGLGDNVHIGGLGDDSIYGSDDVDIILVAAPGEHTAADTVNGGTGVGTDRIRFTSTTNGDTLSLGSNITNVEMVEIANASGGITGTAAVNIDASAVNPAGSFTLSGNNGANKLTGTGQSDVIFGNGGNDTLIGGLGNETFEGGAGNDIILITDADHHGGAEFVLGGDGDDVIRFTGATGPNTLTLSNVIVVERVVIADDAGSTAGTTALNVNATAAGAGLMITGNNGANDILGTAQNDTLAGNGGNDTLHGGAGGNDVVAGGLGDDLLTGGEGGADRLLGEAGNDTMTAQDGPDSLFGGAGDDTYENVTGGPGGTFVSEVANMGLDLVRAGTTYALLLNFENLELLGGAAINGTGNAISNRISGNSGSNVLTGGLGNDTLIAGNGSDTLNGGDGSDTADYSAESVSLTVDLSAPLVLAQGGELGNDTLNGIENLIGGTSNDSLTGNAFNNVLDGGDGADTLTGGAGNDTYHLSQDGETVTEGAESAQGVDTVIQRNMTYDYTLADNVENLTIQASETGWTATGNSLNNRIEDKSGSGLHLTGGAGKDTLFGGAGDDTYVLNVMNGATVATGDLSDVLVEAANQGTDSVHLRGNSTAQTITFILPAQIERVFVFPDMVASTVTLTGNALDNELSAVSMPGGSAMLFDGGAGNDIVLGGLGNDNLKGGVGNDVMEGRSGNDTLTGGAGADNLQGGNDDDIFIYGTATDFGPGESVNGGDGADTLRYTGTAAATLVLTSGVVVENIVIGNTAGVTTGTAAINVNASALTNPVTMIGNNGANMLTGTNLPGADTLTGNGGNDTYRITHDDQVNEGLGGGIDTVIHQGMQTGYDLPDNVERLIMESAEGGFAVNANDSSNTVVDNTGHGMALFGLGGNDSLAGAGGNDTLEGDIGVDTLVGGLGDDVYDLDVGDGDLVDRVIEALDQGTDRVDVHGTGGVDVTYTLAANVENATLNNNGDRKGTLIGNGLGNSLSADGEGGGTFVLSGAGGDDVLSGSTGNDTLIGGAGNDALDGGDGFDVASFVGGTAAVTLSLESDIMGGGGAGVGTDTLLSIEGAIGTAFNDTLVGAVEGNLLFGGAGNDSLVGADGNDTLEGGAGNDRLDGQDEADTASYATATTAVTVNLQAGTATGTSTGADVLAGIENATGSNFADRLTGDGTSNALDGGGGNDTLMGGGGGDFVSGGAGNDRLDGGEGVDILAGGDGNDALVFDALDTTVSGGAGVDTLLVSGAGVHADLTAIADGAFTGIEAINLTGTGNNTLTLAVDHVLAITDTPKTLRIDGNAGDVVDTSDVGWQQIANQTIGTQVYARYVNGAATLLVDLDIDRSGIGVNIFNLSGLNGPNGFTLTGPAGTETGQSVSSAGDVNGDGFADLLVGSNSPAGAAPSFVVFGKAAFTATMDLGALNGVTGFKLSGAPMADNAGFSVSNAGDVNGDGFGDLLIGAPRSDVQGIDSGASFVVFGKSGGFAANLALSGLNGTNGFKIDGPIANAFSGRSVSGAGDINGDGYDDIAIASESTQTGAAHVVFGAPSFSATPIGLSGLDGANGFELRGSDGADVSVGHAGDVNGDGFDDLIVGMPFNNGAPPAGGTFVVFGKQGPFAAFVNADDLNGTDGFELVGETGGDASGYSVDGAGDVNGDGLADLIVGAHQASAGANDNGASYIVFGRADFSSTGGEILLASLNGTTGFKVSGAANFDYSGFSVSTAGDINGDGYDDLIIGAKGADRVPDDLNAYETGVTYVLFGKSGGFDAEIDLSDLTNPDLLRLNGVTAYDNSGSAVSGAGDINGDGFDDLVVGAAFAGTGGVSYVVFGRDFRDEVGFLGTAGSNNLLGTGTDEILIGGLGNDTLDGGIGVDVLRGGAGNDVLIFDGDDRRVDGGGGSDILRFTGTGQGIDLTATTNLFYTDIEIVDLTGTGNNTLILSLRDLLDLSGSTNTLRVDGNAGDVVDSSGPGWTLTPGGPIAIGANQYNSYTSGAGTLLIDTDITQTNVN